MTAKNDPWDDLVRGMPRAAVEEARALVVEVRLAPGDLLAEAGIDATDLFFLLEGRLDVVRDGVRVDACGPGALLGEMAMFRTVRRVASLRAVEPSRALKVSRVAWRALLASENPVVFELERRILAQLVDRLRRLDGLVADRSAGEANPFPSLTGGVLGGLRDLARRVSAGRVVPHRLDAGAVLEGSHLFRGAPREALDALGAAFQTRSYAPGDALCREGDPADRLFVVASGLADVVGWAGSEGRVHKLGEVGPGAAVGVMALVDGSRRLASVVAQQQVDALTLDSGELRALVGRPGVAASALRTAMIRALADQIDEASRNVVALTTGHTSRDVHGDPISGRRQPSVQTLVRLGHADLDAIVATFLAHTAVPVDEATLRAEAREELEAHRARMRDWPAVTDCDRLAAAFVALGDRGIVGLPGVGDDRVAVREAGLAAARAQGLAGWCGHDRREPERVLETGRLHLSVGAVAGGYEASAAIAEVVVEVLRGHGLDAAADYLLVEVGMTWQRR